MTESELKKDIINSLKNVVTDIDFSEIDNFIAKNGLNLSNAKTQCLMYLGIKKARE